MNKYQRILVLFSTILFLGGVLMTGIVPLADATSGSGYKAFSDANNAVTDCNVPQDYPNIQEAINNLDCDLVNVAAGTFVENVVINHDVTIQGAGITSTIVDGNDNGTVIEIQEGLAVTLTNLTIRNGRPLTTPVSEGGGIQVLTGTLTLVDTLVTNNTAHIAGAGVYGYASIIAVQHSQVVSNSAGYYGGGIAGFFGSVTTIENSTISNNSAMFGGGFSGGDINVIASTVTGNQADYGGGFYTVGGYITVTGSYVSSNIATETGGGIAAWGFPEDSASVIVTNSSFTNNDASYGGGIAGGPYAWVEIEDSVISSNSATGSGGGIRIGDDTLILQNSTLHGNSANSGGGIFNEGSHITITYSTLSLNSAFDDGGGIYNLGGTLTLNNSTLSDNRSPLGGYGGGIYAASYGNGLVTLNNSTLNNNSAAAGGGIYIEGADTVATTGSIIAGNNGADCSGTITSQGYNIASDNSCSLNGPGDMNNTDPQLGPLQDNGGPTQTHLPLAGSLAVDTGNPLNCPPTDQRGFPRPYDGDGDGNAVCDIGSVEYSALLPLSGVTIQGPITGSVQTDYTFTAVVTPISATQPITYVWQTAGQPPVTHTGGITDTAVFSWSASGAQVLTITASNSVSSATASTTVTILGPQYLIYLPLVIKP